VNDLRPLLASSDNDDAKRLLEAARAFKPSNEARQRMLTAMGNAEPASGVSRIPRWLRIVTGTSVAGLAILGGATHWARQPSSPVAQPAPSATNDRSPTPTAFVATGVADSVDAPRSPPAAPVVSPEPDSREHPAPPSVAASLSEEIAMIDRARQALVDHDPARALRLTSEHDRRFPRGALTPESRILRVQALLAVGDRPGATQLAESMIQQNPDGAYALRAKHLLDASPAP
jgi:hypothetical protein